MPFVRYPHRLPLERPITVPPLRDRVEDIPLIVKALVEELSAGVGKRFETVFRADVDALSTYQWPGNVRELRNIIERAMIVSAGPCLRILSPQARSGEQPSPARSLQEVEREHVLTVLGETAGVSPARGAPPGSSVCGRQRSNIG